MVTNNKQAKDMEMLNLTQEQKNKVIDEFLDSIKNWKDCLALTKFVLMKLSQEAISMNAGELALSQSLSHNGERYDTYVYPIFKA